MAGSQTHKNSNPTYGQLPQPELMEENMLVDADRLEEAFCRKRCQTRIEFKLLLVRRMDKRPSS